ncbi:TolC family protein [Mucilaginibacter phyllosphaerae]|uniref:Cobalt-zinc-cadmium efflux system outer membrane protein n=1 Tax=Mucilaginibacter phyllosphaerae TaxID=1812349 RepID=A0A4Y8ACK4_9SPHI|nr:TolC family protein [Mucilaginibacter phyllosphaerae]MBB3969425.1 cobalt-zinc-cadmium efflux system outer membrane protein [Mucilaginibacter phyllosphaerae]TEW65789.1 TolC family protein [Mucilaginibacter phyllosphaerae]GGH08445.1 cation transporter [Mucilaginibacter phyllosphaerae]
MLRRYYKILGLFAIVNFGAQNASAQTDTLRFTFKDAEKTFLDNNLSLLAQKYNVDAAQALVKQAKLWDNPTLSTDQNITDANKKFFDHSNGNGQILVQLSQVFKTAGKRGKQVQVAQDGVQIQQAQFNDLLRNLHYNLLLDFAQVANLIDQRRVYQLEITSASNMVNATDKSYQAGNNSLKDLIRLKALLFGLQNDLVEIDRQINDLQSELKTLLVTDPNKFITPIVTFNNTDTTLNAATLTEQAKANRGDYLANQYLLNQNNHNLALQKAMAVPDLTIGSTYDQNSSYARNFVGLEISLPLPIFNRNQGNIKNAKLAAQSQEYLLKNNEVQLNNDVYSAVQQYRLSQQLLGSRENDFYSKYDQLFKGMSKAYQLKQINLQEYVDFFDSYRETKLKILQQQLNLQKAVADLNFAVGTTVVTPL